MATQRANWKPIDADDVPQLALRYVPSLERLVALSSEFDQLSGESVDRTTRKKVVLRISKALEIEKNLLATLDADVKNFIRCCGGPQEIVRRVEARAAARVKEDELFEYLYKMLWRRVAFVALEKFFHYGSDLSGYPVSEDDKLYVTRYFEGSLEPTDSGRGDEANTAEPAFRTADAALQSLARVLADGDPGGSPVRTALETITGDLAGRSAQWSEEVTDRIKRRSDTRTLRLALKLASLRAELVDKCISGIIRCIGGPQRLAMESAAGNKPVKYSRMLEICDRFMPPPCRTPRTSLKFRKLSRLKKSILRRPRVPARRISDAVTNPGKLFRGLLSQKWVP